MEDVTTRLTEAWGGRLVAERELEAAVMLGSSLMLLSEKQAVGRRSCLYPYLHCCHGHLCHHSETVFNICLEVGDVAQVAERMAGRGSRVVVSPCTITCQEGRIQFALVSSPCENILHSLVNTKHFHGTFLPGFSKGGVVKINIKIKFIRVT